MFLPTGCLLLLSSVLLFHPALAKVCNDRTKHGQDNSWFARDGENLPIMVLMPMNESALMSSISQGIEPAVQLAIQHIRESRKYSFSLITKIYDTEVNIQAKSFSLSCSWLAPACLKQLCVCAHCPAALLTHCASKGKRCNVWCMCAKVSWHHFSASMTTRCYNAYSPSSSISFYMYYKALHSKCTLSLDVLMQSQGCLRMYMSFIVAQSELQRFSHRHFIICVCDLRWLCPINIFSHESVYLLTIKWLVLIVPEDGGNWMCDSL